MRRIKEILEETGSDKVNIIAHSKGGLDSRYAISCLGAAPYVASLTTINTPHRGCEFADWLLKNAPDVLKKTITEKYNRKVCPPPLRRRVPYIRSVGVKISH